MKIYPLISSAVATYALSAGLAAAASTSTGTSTVGAPNTGGGGYVAVNITMLALSAIVAGCAALLFAREQSA